MREPNRHLETKTGPLFLNKCLALLNGLLLRHAKSWEVVAEFVQENYQVWSVRLEQSILPTLLPWLDGQMERLTFNRVRAEECYVLYICLPTMGVVPAGKQNFVAGLVTAFLAARPQNSVAVIIHANRASESKRACGP